MEDWYPIYFGLMGLTRILDDREHALRRPVKNAAVRHSSCQAVVKGAASSTFSRVSFLNDGNAAWKQLMDRCEGIIHREPEVKRVRALLHNLRLDLSISGYD